MRAAGAQELEGFAGWTSSRCPRRRPWPEGCSDRPKWGGRSGLARPRGRAARGVASQGCLCSSLRESWESCHSREIVLLWPPTNLQRCSSSFDLWLGSLRPFGTLRRRQPRKHQARAAKWNKNLINAMFMKAENARVKRTVPEHLHKAEDPLRDFQQLKAALQVPCTGEGQAVHF